MTSNNNYHSTLYSGNFAAPTGNFGHKMRTPRVVPPAPVLSFPTMYNGRKGSNTNKTPSPAKEADAQPSITTPTRLPPDIHDFVLGIDDFRRLSLAERERLLEGPTVSITVNMEYVAKVPLRLLLAASQRARKIYLSSPKQPLTSINIPVEKFKVTSVFKTAVKELAGWMTRTCTTHRAFWFAQRTIDLDVYLLAVASQLGMDDYFSHFDYRKALHRDPLNLTTLLLIENAAPSPNFRLLATLVERLANDLVSGARSTKDAEFVNWMSACPRVSAQLRPKYAAKQADYNSRQAAIEAREEKASRREELKAIEEMTRLRLGAQHAQAELESRLAREQGQALKDRARRTINAGGVKTISVEEAALVPRRGR